MTTKTTAVTCQCDPQETDVIGQMRAASGATSDANLIRVALWSLANQLGIEMSSDVFAVRVEAKARKPHARHPWRQYAEPKQ